MSSHWIEGLEHRQFLSVAPIAGAQARVRGADAPGVMIQQHDRDRVNDGSCQATATVSAAAAPTADTTRIRLRDRLNDGSCQTAATTTARPAIRTQLQDQLRDGSCKA